MNTHAIDVTDDRSYTRETCTSSGHNADVFVCVLAELSLAVLLVVQVGNRLAQFWHPRSARAQDVMDYLPH